MSDNKQQLEYQTWNQERLYIAQIMLSFRTIFIAVVFALIAAYFVSNPPLKSLIVLGLIANLIWFVMDIIFDCKIQKLYPRLIRLEKSLGVSGPNSEHSKRYKNKSKISRFWYALWYRNRWIYTVIFLGLAIFISLLLAGVICTN